MTLKSRILLAAHVSFRMLGQSTEEWAFSMQWSRPHSISLTVKILGPAGQWLDSG